MSIFILKNDLFMTKKQYICSIFNLIVQHHYCPLKIASRSLKLLEYSLLQEILIRNDLKS